MILTADVCSSFLCSYVLERGVGNSFIGRLLRVTPYIRPFSNDSGHRFHTDKTT